MQPNFLVIGAAKSGTTWLHSCLAEHPDIFVPREKELHYFSYPEYFANGDGWYEKHFDAAAGESAVGEVSPSYLPHPEAIDRIREYNPDMRLVCMLRDPVARAYSHYCMALRTGQMTRDVDAGLTLDCPYVRWGKYYEQLEHVFERFPPEQVKVLLFDDIKHDPTGLLRGLFEFLRVDPDYQPPSATERKNTARVMPRYPKLYQTAKRTQHFIESRSNRLRGVIFWLRMNKGLEFFHKLNKGEDFPKMSDEKRRELIEHFRDDIDRLAQLIRRDLSAWTSS